MIKIVEAVAAGRIGKCSSLERARSGSADILRLGMFHLWLPRG
jgi:hypothetical protein